MKTIIFIVLALWLLYLLAVHVVHALWGIGSDEAREKVNQAIIRFFEAPKPDPAAELSRLNREEWCELEDVLNTYFYRTILDGYDDNTDGTFSIAFRSVGVLPRYSDCMDVLSQCLTIDVNDFLLKKLGMEYPIHLRTCNGRYVHILLAYDSRGLAKIQSIRDQIRRADQRLPVQAPLRLTFKKNLTSLMCLGLRYEEWHEKQQKIPIVIDLISHPHLLLLGSSGTGKSYALNYYVRQLLCKSHLYQLWFGDYKNSTDFRYLRNYERVSYRTGDDVCAMIGEYFELFCRTRDGKLIPQTSQVLILDEYPSLIQMAAMADKKKAEQIRQMIATLLMMGRDVNGKQFAVIITTQRPDASLFSSTVGGGRDNFMSVVALGNLSSEAKGMITDVPSELPRADYQRGEGICRIDGRGTSGIIIPEIVYYRPKHPERHDESHGSGRPDAAG